MEKKGEILNQLALISDLLEKINLTSNSKTVVIELGGADFEKIYKLITSKVNIATKGVESKFSLRIGEIDFVFNRSNV
jgi:hypothetical protein